MVYLILADIHSNIDALTRVLRDARQSYDQVMVLGDLVGYGANPNEVVDCVRGLKGAIVLRGNHDAAVAGELEFQNFQAVAREVVQWTRQRISPENLAYLKTLPLRHDEGPLHFVHGTLTDPVIEYMMYQETILRNFELIGDGEVIFCGHHHVAHLMTMLEGNELLTELILRTNSFVLEPHRRYIVKTFSVGFPRDGNPEAGWCLYDTEKRLVNFRRSRYNVGRAARAILRAGLPEKNAQRLRLGI